MNLNTLTILWLCFLSTPALPQARTTPQPPKFDDNHIERTDLSAEVPAPIDKFRYRVDGTYSGVTFHPAEVPLWSFTSSRHQIGTLPVGSSLIPEFIRGIEGRNFYGFRHDVKRGEQTLSEIVWVDGRFVKIAGET